MRRGLEIFFGALSALAIFLGAPAHAREKVAVGTPRQVFVVNTQDASVSLVDISAMKEIRRIPVGPRPYGAANEGRSYVDAVEVRSGKQLDRLTEGVSKPCCVERIPSAAGGPTRVLISNIEDGTLQLAEVSPEGKLRSIAKAKVGKAPKRVAFMPASQ